MFVLTAHNRYPTNMPITRSAFQRYRLIDETISRYPRRYSKQQLFELCQDKCGIRSISSLEKDIQRMREDHDAPIEYDKRSNGYYYSNPQFRLLNLMLSPEDMEALDYAREVLAATQGATVADELTNALQKVRQSLDIIREVKSDGSPGSSRRIVYVEEKILGGNRQYVPILIRAVNQNRQVAFRYLKHEDAVSMRSAGVMVRNKATGDRMPRQPYPRTTQTSDSAPDSAAGSGR